MANNARARCTIPGPKCVSLSDAHDGSNEFVAFRAFDYEPRASMDRQSRFLFAGFANKTYRSFT